MANLPGWLRVPQKAVQAKPSLAPYAETGGFDSP